ncbi:unnamed protein product [Symbiodinium sp. CCMP2456]|nr:unnamed protein product [Symbiodinium sp. CCMP2456]
MSRPALRHSGQMRCLSLCFIACLSCGVGLDCSGIRDCGTCAVSCSSLAKCNTCAQERGCIWDAKNLKCVERSRSAFNNACQGSDADSSCLISSSEKCPSTAGGLCSEYKDDLKACLKDPACGWSTELSDRDVVGGSCVEAKVPFSACRGGGVFSYFDAEPHCNALRNCSVCIAEEQVSCTWCSGELLDDYTPRSSRCVLSRGAMGGTGDRSGAAHIGHSCAAFSDTAEKCNHCRQFSTCDDCIKDPGCGACLASSGRASCVEGDRHNRFSSCQMKEPVKFWAHEGAGSGQGSQCMYTDVCRMATSCPACQAIPPDHGLDCVWCNNSVPLQSAPAESSPCQRRDLCPAQSRHPKGECAPSMLAPLCSSYKSCTECIAQHTCAWAHKNGCVRSSSAYSASFLPYVWGDAAKCPEVCGSHKDSTSCTKHEGCGWCGFSAATFEGCFPGDSSGCHRETVHAMVLWKEALQLRREVRGFISRFRQGESSSNGEIALGRL